MGNHHGTHHGARRWSLIQEEYTFPEPSWELYEDWEIYHIDIELNVLPPHIRDAITVCVHEYTQEIICEEDENTDDDGYTDTLHLSTAEMSGSKSDLQCDRLLHDHISSGLTLPEDQASSSACSQCSPDLNAPFARNTQSSNCVSSSKRKSPRDKIILVDSFFQDDADELDALFQTKTSFPESQLSFQDDSDVCNQCSQCPDVLQQSGLKNDICSGEPCDESNSHVKELCACRTTSHTSDGNSFGKLPKDNRASPVSHLVYEKRQKSSSDCGLSVDVQCHPLGDKSCTASDQGQNACCSQGDSTDKEYDSSLSGCVSGHSVDSFPSTTSPGESESSKSQSQVEDCDGACGRVCQRTATYSFTSKTKPVPVPFRHNLSSPPNSPSSTKKRKFSLKDEPGWIPNPLDSDSDSDEFEDSGVFSDASKSSRQASESPVIMSTYLSVQMQVDQRTERRRCNSEPSPGVPAISVGSAGTSSYLNSISMSPSSAKKSNSKWKLIHLPWRKNKPRLERQSHLQNVQEPPEISQETDELDEHLAWLTNEAEEMDSQSTDSAHEDLDDDQLPEEDSTSLIPDAEILHPSSDAADTTLSVSPFHQQQRPAWEQELDLDWLCEPEWNNLEMELFWTVLRPHLESLLVPHDNGHLPDPCMVVCCLDSSDHKMLDRCLLHVQWHIWKGNYRQAVADFQIIRRHFRCCAKSLLIESESREDIEILRLVFQRKRPSRLRLWI